MGKKHKKHKSEKHAYEEYAEKPLKLVIKVGGGEVTELSTMSSGHDSSMFEDKSDHDNDKKKKKKKKMCEKAKPPPVPVVQEKKKKKTEKKKKGQDSMDTDVDERSQTPVRAEMLHEKHMSASLAKVEEKEQSPLQEALTQLTQQLLRKDPRAFFSFPVTDFIAPGYSQIIKHPMDFSTIKEKIKADEYHSLEELRADFKTMCENAMMYNKPQTIYFKAAKKLLHFGMTILSQDRLQSLKQSIQFMADLENANKQKEEQQEEETDRKEDSALDQSREPAEPMDTDEVKKASATANKEIGRQDSKDSVSKIISAAEKELERIEKIIEESGGKLTRRNVESQLEFERWKSDGTTTLGFLNPADLSMGEPGYCPVKLGMMMDRLQTGINTLQGFKEDKRNRVTPVSYTNYGPYSSYAPVYDSSVANVSKADSDLIYSFYGDESSLEVPASVHQFLENLDEYTYKMADNMLDALTNGEHSKSLREMGMTVQGSEERTDESAASNDIEIVEAHASSNDGFTSPSVTAGLEMETPSFDSKESEQFQKKLDETTQLLQELQEAQNERLSAKPPPNIVCLLAPTVKEIQLAEKVTGNLKHMASQVTPGDITSVYGIRKVMGVAVPARLLEQSLVDLTAGESASHESVNDF
ncbi:bromodomain-containing protein 7-like isoform X2 [Polyodon spathula]|uniref:bromodomain-containing protein 7-like isoform X2 n=1 Tax=Polyodon spathula TaxID=7913 RepID=UPI001B7EAD4D|nr:bromodomain-containing protein 7-like isoform X2 [Polyodon spathula]